MKNYTFVSAKPVWEKGTEEVMNRWLIFRTECQKSDNAVLALTGSCAYTVRVNGEFVAFGPARCAHGFFRVDELDISKYLTNDQNVVTVTVAGYNLNSFYHLDQPSFLCAELLLNGNVVSATGNNGFDCYRCSEHEERVTRYSFQRTFSEVYNIKSDTNDVHTLCGKIAREAVETELTDDKKFIYRGCSYNNYPVRDAIKVIKRGNFKFGSHGSDIAYNRTVTWVGNYYAVSDRHYKGYKLNELTTNTILYTENLDTVDAVNVCEPANDVVIKKNSFALTEFAVNTTGAFEFDIECAGDATLVVKFDETLLDGDVEYHRVSAYNTMIFRVAKGRHKISSFEPYTCKYLKLYAIGADITLHKISSRFFGADLPKCSLKSNDKELKEIFDAAVETYRQNTFTIFMDCPSRERAGWLCDSFFTGRVENLLYGNSEVEHNFLENFLLPKSFIGHPDGILPMCYPGDQYNGEFIPNWDMFFVIELEEYLHRSGDKELVEEARETVYKMLRYFEKFENKDGLLEKLVGWVFLEWSKSNQLTKDINYPTNMLYVRTLKAAARLYNDESFAKKAEALKKKINEISIMPSGFYCDNSVYDENGVAQLSGICTESCQYYAFFSGVATKEENPVLWERLLNDFGPERVIQGNWPNLVPEAKWQNISPSNSFIGNYLRLELLSIEGENEKLIENIRGYFIEMARTTGTLWENMSIRSSLCHGFASHVLYWFDKLGLLEK